MLETNRKEQFLTKGTALKRCYRKEKRLMANLNTRQKKCLELLLNEKEFRSAKYLAEKLQVSDKTVLQDIKAIQEYLNPFHVTLIRKTGSGILLPEKARGNQELLNGLRSSAGEEGSVPAEFRRMEIIKRLLLMDESCLSIQKLSDEFYVSRASIVNDFKAIENWVADYGLTLVTSRKGRSLEGPEKGIRHAIAAWVRENNPSKNTEITPGEYMQSGAGCHGERKSAEHQAADYRGRSRTVRRSYAVSGTAMQPHDYGALLQLSAGSYTDLRVPNQERPFYRMG